MKLSNEEMIKIEGGRGSSLLYSTLVGIGGFILLVIGILDGYTNHEKCHT